MTILVPFDGSELAQSALVRASALGEAFDAPVFAVTVVPENDVAYARDHGWLGPDEEFDAEKVVNRLEEQVTEVAPSAGFRPETVGRFASAGTIANRVRRLAKEADASLVVIGSDNAGHMVSSIHSVGSTVASDDAFDVLIVRRPVDAPSESGW